jgi:DNA-directed RNA polymerase subunit RPC12/RpoP
MKDEVKCPTCGEVAEHLIGRLYRCNSCKSSVKNWIEPDEVNVRDLGRVSQQTTG